MSGRTSISQVTTTQAIFMFALGSLIIQPVSSQSLGQTFLAATILVLLMILAEYLQLKFDFFESISTGKAKLIIENGKINMESLKKLRFSVDKLEARLREIGVSNLDDIEWATLEVSGQIGYCLKKNKQPSTKEDIQEILQRLHQLEKSINPHLQGSNKNSVSLFKELKSKEFEGNQNEP